MNKTYVRCDKRECKKNTHYDDPNKGWCTLRWLHIMENGLCKEYLSHKGERHLSHKFTGRKQPCDYDHILLKERGARYCENCLEDLRR